eukprot:391566-Hanusia_phi.AAC.1
MFFSQVADETLTLLVTVRIGHPGGVRGSPARPLTEPSSPISSPPAMPVVRYGSGRAGTLCLLRRVALRQTLCSRTS